MTATKWIPGRPEKLSPRTFGIGFVAGVVVTLLTLMILDSEEDDFTSGPTVLEASEETSDDVIFTFAPILKSGEMPKATAETIDEDKNEAGSDTPLDNIPN